MAQGNNNPVINPILSLLRTPTPSTVSGGGKSAKGIVTSRLADQQLKLAKQLKSVKDDKDIISLAGRLHLIAKMFPDSYAPSWTPDDLFESSSYVRIVSPAYNGYLIEVEKEKLDELINKVNNPKSAKVQVDISRLQSIKAFDKDEVLRGNKIEDIFDMAQESGLQFNFWLLPYHDAKAKILVSEEIEKLFRDNALGFGDKKFDNIFNKDGFKNTHWENFQDKIKKYLVDGVLAFTANVENKKSLERIVSSGAVYRIEPVKKIVINAVPPGEGAEPSPAISNAAEMPAVVIIDGGCSASSYMPLNVMSITPLVDKVDANLKHGNQVTSLICQASAWNNKLALPALECKFISVQAIIKDDIPKQPTTDQFVNYLWDVAEETKEVSSVWNLSFNERSPSYNKQEISYLGHEINKIARQYNILPVISIGNATTQNPTVLCAPADCEAGLTISGRMADSDGMPAGACQLSLRGPAPAGMKKPELSWFSCLRMIGGATETGTSFSTPLVSSIAAHTFKNLKNPTPDLVKALLINKSDSYAHDFRLGWGSPWSRGNELPWLCEEGTVTLAWNSKIKAGFNYYWNDIPLPPEMLINGKLKGEIILTAILKPLVSELCGENYFATRLQCALQAVDAEGKSKNLLGSMKESKEKEVDSRAELAKWSPVRHHGSSFQSVSLDGRKLRIYARIYARDLYQFGMSNHQELDEQDVAFVLTFRSENKDKKIYNSMVQSLGNDVEVGVINQDININNDL